MNKSFYDKNTALAVVFVNMLVGLSACSSVDNALDTTTAVKYANNASVAVLKSPKGLVPPEYDMTFALPESSAVTNNPTLVDIRPPDLIK
jgi:uncharacterized lipoprotein